MDGATQPGGCLLLHLWTRRDVLVRINCDNWY